MEEKRTFGSFVKDNKKKIITGALVVVGVVVGVLVTKKLLNTTITSEIVDLSEHVIPNEEAIVDTIESIVEVTNI